MKSRDLLLESLEGYLRERMAQGRDENQPEQDAGNVTEKALAAIDRIISEETAPQRWLYLRISVLPENAAEFMARDLAPILCKMQSDGDILGWWWLGKQDITGSALRIRIYPQGRFDSIAEFLETHLKQIGCRFSRLQYEPEMRLFGGSTGIDLAHRLFCCESRFLADWMQTDISRKPPLLPPGLSLALIFKLITACGLDIFECWDLFDKVCDKRGASGIHEKLIEETRTLARKVLLSGPEKIFQLYQGLHAHLLAQYRTHLEGLASEIAVAHFNGRLEYGLRQFLVPIVLFHWNRIDMPAHYQIALANATRKELAELCTQGQSRKNSGMVVASCSQDSGA